MLIRSTAALLILACVSIQAFAQTKNYNTNDPSFGSGSSGARGVPLYNTEARGPGPQTVIPPQAPPRQGGWMDGGAGQKDRGSYKPAQGTTNPKYQQ
jgi:hypothetical protein